MKIAKDIEINENVLTIYNIINLIYCNYSCDLPLEISQKINELLEVIINNLEKDYLDLDIANSKLIRKIEFYKEDK